MTLDDVPTPSASRPGAAWASDPTLCARHAGPRVKAGTMAVPSRSVGAHTEASASGVKASAPLASDDHTSVYPRSASSTTRSRWAWSGRPSNGMVMP
jgi:hypothetical protein